MTTQKVKFAIACLEQCSSAYSLRQALEGGADTTDCRVWGIDARDWAEAVEMALNAYERDGAITDCGLVVS